MSSKKTANEQFMDGLNSIRVLLAYRDFIKKRYRANHVRPIIMELTSFNVSFEQLRQESYQELICRYLASINEDLELSHFMKLVKYKDVFDPEIIVWIPANEICQVFGLQLKDLCNYAENGQLAMLELEEDKFFNWYELKNLTGSS